MCIVEKYFPLRDVIMNVGAAKKSALSSSDRELCLVNLFERLKALPNATLLSSLQWRSRAKVASSPALASAPASLFTPVALTPAALASTPAKTAPCWLCCRPATTEASPICSSPLTATTCTPVGARWTHAHTHTHTHTHTWIQQHAEKTFEWSHTHTQSVGFVCWADNKWLCCFGKLVYTSSIKACG